MANLKQLWDKLRSGSEVNEPRWTGLQIGLETDPPDSERVVVDANTRTYWSRADQAAATLVEAEIKTDTKPTVSKRVARLLAGQENQQSSERTRGNPVFSETLFIELMRAKQFARAFAQLSPPCQIQWGSVDNFVIQQEKSSVAQVQSVNVRKVNYLPKWIDENSGIIYQQVAQLEAEYTVGNQEKQLSIVKTVHLVSVGGKWKSLYYPPTVNVLGQSAKLANVG